MSRSVVGGRKTEVGGRKTEVGGQRAEVGELGQRVMMAVAAWEKDCSDPDLLGMYVAPVVGKSDLALAEDPEWAATVQEWIGAGEDEAYLPDFVLAYAEVATGAVAVGPLTEDKEFYVKYDAWRSRAQALESELRKWQARADLLQILLMDVADLEEVADHGLRVKWKMEMFTKARRDAMTTAA